MIPNSMISGIGAKILVWLQTTKIPLYSRKAQFIGTFAN